MKVSRHFQAVGLHEIGAKGVGVQLRKTLRSNTNCEDRNGFTTVSCMGVKRFA
jgi:hypothetical protein